MSFDDAHVAEICIFAYVCPVLLCTVACVLMMDMQLNACVNKCMLAVLKLVSG